MRSPTAPTLLAALCLLTAGVASAQDAPDELNAAPAEADDAPATDAPPNDAANADTEATEATDATESAEGAGDDAPPAGATTPPADDAAPTDASAEATGDASDTNASATDPSEGEPPAPAAEQPAAPPADAPAATADDDAAPPANAPITEEIGERDSPSIKSFARTTVVSQEVALAPAETATVMAASGAACVACSGGPCVLGAAGGCATLALSSAYSPCVGFGGGTAAALFGVGGCTVVSVPFLLGPAAILLNLAATTGALFFGTDFDLDLVLRVVAGAAPGALMALLSVAAIIAGIGVLFLGVLAAPAIGGGSLVLAIMPGAAVLAAAAFNGLLAGFMTFAGVSATALTNTRWDDSGTLEKPPAPPPAAALRERRLAMAY